MKFHFIILLILFSFLFSQKLEKDNNKEEIENTEESKKELNESSNLNLLNYNLLHLNSEYKVKVKEKCELFAMNQSYNKLGVHFKNFKNVKKITITDKHPGSTCSECTDDSLICQTSYISSELKDENNKKKNQYVNYFSRICLNLVYILIEKENEEEESSFLVESVFYNEEPCLLKTLTHLDYCGQSNMEDCRSCQRKGCSVINCGNYSNNKFVSNSFKLFLLSFYFNTRFPITKSA